jgi:hypothetical protein
MSGRATDWIAKKKKTSANGKNTERSAYYCWCHSRLLLLVLTIVGATRAYYY